MTNWTVHNIMHLNKSEFSEWWNGLDNNQKYAIYYNYDNTLYNYALDKFEIWYDVELVIETCLWYEIKHYCSKYKYIWEKDYLVYKLQQEGRL